MKSLRLMAATSFFVLALTFSASAQSDGNGHTGGIKPQPTPVIEKTTDTDATDTYETDGFWATVLSQLLVSMV